ncbi:MAG: hypothetical protein ACRERC_20425 [Candidatus Binatia bacterium]
MSRPAALAVAAVLALAVVARADDSGSPQHMTTSDGELNMEICGACHTEDMSLQRSKLETCTLCHSQTQHAGASEHVTASAAAVKVALANQPKDGPPLPLAEDGRMFCGTCHLFHDPKVMGEDWLAQGWIPPDSGLSATVRQTVIERWAKLAAKSEDKAPIGRFATKGTRQLRLPVDKGQLCAQCHGALR